MSEEEARRWIAAQFGHSAVAALARFADLVIAESERQNLVAKSTLQSIWRRHLLDSAQLVALAPAAGLWIDIGSGAGFPGLVVAMLRPSATLLVEPRRQRAEFLAFCVETLGLRHVQIHAGKVESVRRPASVISARAVGPVEKLLHAAAGCATTGTCWLLPRGRFGADDVSALHRHWGGLFHMKQSVSDPSSTILIGDGIFRR